MSIQLLWGNEPYGIRKRREKALKGLSLQEMNYSVYDGSFDSAIKNACLVYPFMDSKRVVVLNVSSLSDLETKEFEEYLKAPSATTELLIIADNVDKRKKTFKKLSDLGCVYPCDKVNDNDLKKVLQYEISSRGAQITEVAYAEFCKRCSYQDNDDMNILGMLSFIDSMVSVSKEITPELVERFVPKYEEPNVFGLTALIKKNDVDGLYRELSLIEASSDEQIKTLSLLLRDYRIAYKLKLFEKTEVADRPQSVRTSFSDYSMSELISCMEILTNTIADIKSGKMPSDFALRSASIKLITINKERAL